MLLGFVVPVLYLLQQSFRRGLLTNFDMSLGRDAFNSVAFATLATLVALALGFATILAWRWRPNAARFIAMNISQTGYALPGLVLALGLLTPVLAIDNGLNAVAGWLGRSLPGLILVGSGAAVVIAYVIRFLAVPTGMIKAGFERIPRDYDDSARAAGAGQSTTMRQDPSAAAAAGDAGRGHHRVRGLPEGIAGDAAAAADERRYAGDLDLPVRQPRQF